jgi:uncharacterized membrane protein YccC
MPTSLSRWTRITGSADLDQGLRGAAGWFGCITAGLVTDRLALGFVAGMVAWIVAFSDTPIGMYPRLRGAFFQILFVTASVGVAAWASAWQTAALGTTAVLGTIVAMSAVGGPSMARRTSASMLVILFATGTPGQLIEPFPAVLASAGGGAVGLALILATAPYARGRGGSASARQFREVAALARLYAGQAPAQMISLARIELSRATADAYSGAALSWPASAGPQTASQISLANSITQHLASAIDAEETVHGGDDDLVLQMCHNVAKTCDQVAEILTDRREHLISIGATLYSIDRVLAVWQALHPNNVAGIGALRDLRSDIEQVPDIRNLAGLSPQEMRKRSQPSTLDWFAGLRSDDLLRRYGIRYVVLLIVAAVIHLWSDIPDGYLIPILVTIILRPDLNGSWERVAAYCAAVCAGAVVGVGLAAAAGDAAPLTVVFTTCALLLAIGYSTSAWWAFPSGVTAFMLCAAGLLLPHDWGAHGWRLADTAVAVAVSLVGVLLIWPNRAVTLLREAYAQSLEASAAYLSAVAAGEEGEQLRASRRYASRVTASAGAAVKEYATMPYHSRTALMSLRAVLPGLQRTYGAVTELASLRNAGRRIPDVRPAVETIRATAAELESGRLQPEAAMGRVRDTMAVLLRAAGRT